MPQRAVTITGLPFDANSSFLRGPAKGPDAIRQAFFSEHTSLTTETGVDLENKIIDLGDADYASDKPFLDVTQQAAVAALGRDKTADLFFGGDHSLTWPVLRAAAHRWPGLTVLHFDAHPDLYEQFQGSRDSHACPFARVMEEKLAGRLIQIGVRTLPTNAQQQAEKFSVEVHLARNFGTEFPRSLDLHGPVYVSFDMDVLDPAFAPGVSHHEPGGLSTRQALDVLHAAFADGNARLVAADVVELNPDRDVNGITAQAAAKVAKELAGIMLA